MLLNKNQNINNTISNKFIGLGVDNETNLFVKNKDNINIINRYDEVEFDLSNGRVRLPNNTLTIEDVNKVVIYKDDGCELPVFEDVINGNRFKFRIKKELTEQVYPDDIIIKLQLEELELIYIDLYRTVTPSYTSGKICFINETSENISLNDLSNKLLNYIEKKFSKYVTASIDENYVLTLHVHYILDETFNQLNYLLTTNLTILESNINDYDEGLYLKIIKDFDIIRIYNSPYNDNNITLWDKYGYLRFFNIDTFTKPFKTNFGDMFVPNDISEMVNGELEFNSIEIKIEIKIEEDEDNELYLYIYSNEYTLEYFDIYDLNCLEFIGKEDVITKFCNYPVVGTLENIVENDCIINTMFLQCVTKNDIVIEGLETLFLTLDEENNGYIKPIYDNLLYGYTFRLSDLSSDMIFGEIPTPFILTSDLAFYSTFKTIL